MFTNELIWKHNNKSKWYSSDIPSIVMIRLDALKKLCEHLKLKYFAFTERFIPGSGYMNDCENHYQIEDGQITRCVHNTSKDNYEAKCEFCPLGFK